tara:strand:+ start:63 stop:1490 length:1428 start_codon:yes stop_codon:yes gene_type:complete
MAKPYIPYAADLLPSALKQPLANNYLSFTDGNNDFAQQYLPEIYEQEVERYGNRTISSFLRMVGAELPMTSDQVIWSEQNRLHVSTNAGVTLATATGVLTMPANATDAYRVQQTVVVTDGYTTAKGIISVITNGTTMTVNPYTANDWAAAGFTNGQAVSLFVYGSEFAKGTVGMEGAIQPAFTQFNNSPIIIKDKYQISGSDAAQIGWVEVAAEDGTSGYLWYLKAEGDTRLRFEDYLEMAVVEGELAAAAAGVNAATINIGTAATTINPKGTEGMFAAIQARGNVYQNFDASQGIDDFDQVLKQLDTQGSIEENMLFVNRSTALNFDDMLGSVSQGGYGGTAYGVFENSEEMALNLGFSGFRRGSYDFYKTDWKYLNDASTRGLAKNIGGVLVPAGTSSVYDQILGTNIRRPFLHVRYRASEADDRRMKSWLTGSVGGAYTSSLDAMEVHFLSERCLCVQAANNFVLFTQTQDV